MKIIDCFTFYNELDLLYLRLAILHEYVDYFILIESTSTHAGHSKTLYFSENKHLYERFKNKIIHVVIDLPYTYPNIDYGQNHNWVNENYQRNYIKEVLIKNNNILSDDLIIISDLDEIISPQRITEIRNGDIILYKGFSLKQDLYYYNIHCKNTWYWSKAKIVTYSYLLEKKPEDIRQENLPLLENAGWHLSYFGNVSFIKNKLQEFVHQEYNHACYTDDSAIEDKLLNGVDLFGRNYVQMQQVSISQNNNLPPLFDPYLLKYTRDYCTKPDLPVYLYYHVACIENWKEIMSRMLFKLKHSGLYDTISKINCTILGNNYDIDDPIFKDPKIFIRFHSSDLSLYERPTLNGILDDAINSEPHYVLYCHSKGVKHYNSETTYNNVYNWCEYLAYFNIYKYNKCIEELNNGADTVGCNLQELGAPLHYSGNFWWARSSHISKLSKIVDNYYNTPEFWVTSISGKYCNLWTSGVNHYNEPYESVLYEGKYIDSNIVTK